MHANLLEFITSKNSGGLSDQDFLKQVARQYPYFTPAQFYLLQQQDETNDTYLSQAAKTALLFNNPHWLNFQLQQTDIVPVHVDKVVNVPLATAVDMPLENSDLPTVIEENSQPEAPVALSSEKDEIITEPEYRSLTQEALMLAEDPDATEADDSFEMEAAIEPVKITIPGLKEMPLNENLPAFEPMHMVDYFASQGIKLTDEVQTADKLGKQLKSFTEWLKTMKKVHVPGTETNAGVSDIAIQALAAKSNKEGEIVTEAMAEVLLQQGKAGKAIEVYKKLSLLNPSKSAFFAAKIEQLKGS